MEKEELLSSIISMYDLEDLINTKLEDCTQYQIHQIAIRSSVTVYRENYNQYMIKPIELAMYIKDADKYAFSDSKAEPNDLILIVSKTITVKEFISKLIESVSISYEKITQEFRIKSNMRIELITNDLNYIQQNSRVISDIQIIKVIDYLPKEYSIELKISDIQNNQLHILLSHQQQYNVVCTSFTMDFNHYFNRGYLDRKSLLLQILQNKFKSMFYSSDNVEGTFEEKKVFTLLDSIKYVESNKMESSSYFLPIELFSDDIVLKKAKNVLPYIMQKLYSIKNKKFRNDVMKNIIISQDIDDYFEGSDEILMMSFEDLDSYLQTILYDYIKILNSYLNPFITELEILNFIEKYDSEIITIKELYTSQKGVDTLSKYKLITHFTTIQKRNLYFLNNKLISDNKFSKVKKHFTN